MTLAEFLLARIAEDETAARAALGPAAYPSSDTAAAEVLWMGRNEGVADEGLDHFSRHVPARVLAEAEAKRRIVSIRQKVEDADDLNHPQLGMIATGAAMATRHLAAVYADHPDYRDEWKP